MTLSEQERKGSQQGDLMATLSHVSSLWKVQETVLSSWVLMRNTAHWSHLLMSAMDKLPWLHFSESFWNGGLYYDLVKSVKRGPITK